VARTSWRGPPGVLAGRAGIDAVRQHWPGTNDGFSGISRLTGLDR
jgi:hypothetical protein